MNRPEAARTTSAVVGLRSMHGYSNTKHDGNVAGEFKTLRRHFGQVYDGNSAGNTCLLYPMRPDEPE